MNCHVYQYILLESLKPFFHQFELKRRWVMQQDNDPKHRSKSKSKWLQQKMIHLLVWPSQSPDLNLDWAAVAWPQELFIPAEIPRILLNWNSFVKRKGFILTVAQVWPATPGNIWVEVTAAKERSFSYWLKGFTFFSCNWKSLQSHTHGEQASSTTRQDKTRILDADKWSNNINSFLSQFTGKSRTRALKTTRKVYDWSHYTIVL